MKDYKIISGSTTDNLADKVHVHLQDGWLPHGSMINGDSEWHQPMIKYDPIIFESTPEGGTMGLDKLIDEVAEEVAEEIVESGWLSGLFKRKK